MIKIRNKNSGRLVAFILPIILLLIIYAIWGQYPFGKHTLLIWDMNWQYSAFFSYLHEILHGDASAVYSFSRAIGGDMISVAAYYLMSPFNLLFYFFDAEHIYIGIFLVTLLKTGFIGLSMFLFLNRKKHDIYMLIFSTAYALCAYVIAYQFNLMWMDALILLPLMVWGIEFLVDKQKYILYIVTIASAVITNFYMGYILCIFSVIYFLCYFFLISEQKFKIKTILAYGMSSLIGGALSMWIALPTLYALQGGKNNFNLETVRSILGNFGELFDSQTLLKTAFMGTICEEQISGGDPLLYCGIFSVLLAVYCFLCGNERLRQKAGYVLLLFSLVFSMKYYNLNCIWHAMSSPMGSPYRFSFLYIFLLLVLASMGWEVLGEKENGKYVLTGIGIILIVVLILQKSSPEFLTRKGAFAVNLALTLCYMILLWIKCQKNIRWKKAINVGFFVIACAELVLNAEYLYINTNQYDSPSVEEYVNYARNIENLLEEIPDTQDFYRTVFSQEAKWTYNDPFLFHIHGLDSYTSVEKVNAQLIARNFGYSHSIIFGAHYENGSSMAAETLLGVKYLVTTDDPKRQYTLLGKSDKYLLYENPNALPLAMLTDASIAKINVDPSDSFSYLNEMYQSIEEEHLEDIFQKVPLIQNGCQNVVQIQDNIYQRKKAEEDAYIDYEIKVNECNCVYLFCQNSGVSEVQVRINDNFISLSEQKSYVKSLGEIKPEDDTVIRFFIGAEEQFHPDALCIYVEQADVLKQYTDEIKGREMDLQIESDSHILLSYQNESRQKKYLFFTIPYESGWKVKIDGECVSTLNIQNCLAIEAPMGTHEVELTFTPEGIGVGSIISGIALCICVVWTLRMKYGIIISRLRKL